MAINEESEHQEKVKSILKLHDSRSPTTILLDQTVDNKNFLILSQKKEKTPFCFYHGYINYEPVVTCMEFGEVLLIFGIAYKFISASGQLDTDTLNTIKEQIKLRTPRITDNLFKRYVKPSSVEN